MNWTMISLALTLSYLGLLKPVVDFRTKGRRLRDKHEWKITGNERREIPEAYRHACGKLPPINMKVNNKR
ncbi:hypothetical protein SAMN05421687_101201 [Salimicrobium flavidum]|uniref:Uncharacterized protein n=1 Tax=Salimicrobium flavidum TaxID=570947 RepID=A0A1N7IIW7_9BACI|nr:hypothetical protein SAMN05421687_101201 [Salimicrobium flavidum]